MGAVLKLLRYLVGLVLFAGGAYVFGLHVAAALVEAQKADAAKGAEGAAAPARPDVVALVKLSIKDAPGSPAWHLGVAAGLAVLGLLIARPVGTIQWGAKRPVRGERKKPLREVVQELSHPDANVRHLAARTLTNAARPQTIPALIKALQDVNQKVRGQACEALTNMTGRTFDFLDVGPQSMRQESMKQWVAWWKANKEAILAGADPKTADAGIAAAAGGFAPGEGPGAAADEAPLPDPDLPPPPNELADEPADAPAGGFDLPSPDEPSPDEPSPEPSAPSAGPASGPRVASEATTRRKRRSSTAMIKRAALGLGSVTDPDEKQDGRNVSIGELIRRKRERAASPAGGAAPAVGEEDAASGAEASASSGDVPAEGAAPSGGPGDAASADGEAPAGDGGIKLADDGPAELPGPDADLPPPE